MIVGQGLGLTPTQRIHVHLALLGYAQGVAAAVELESQAVQDIGTTPEEWMASNEPRMATIQATGAYPALFTLFGFGLARMLDGVESLIEHSGEGPAPGARTGVRARAIGCQDFQGGRLCEDREVSALRFRLADDPDLAAVVRLRDEAAHWMLAQGVTGQWRPGELDVHHFRRIMGNGEVWLAEAADRLVGAWELWWEDEEAWGPQPPTAGYVHRLMVDHSSVLPGTGRQLLRVAERRVAEAGRPLVRLDCLADNASLNAYYLDAGYRVVGRKEGKPQPGGRTKSFTLLEKSIGDGEE